MLAKNIKKYLSINGLILFLLFNLMACNNSSDEKVNNLEYEMNETKVAESLSQQDKANSDTLKKNNYIKKITMILYGDKPEGFEDIVKMIEKESGITAKLDLQWCDVNEYGLKLATAIETENIDMYPTKWSHSNFYKKIDEYADLTKVLPKYAPNLYNELVKSKEIDAYKYQDKIYVLPNMYKPKRCIAVNFDKEYADKYAINKIETFEDYIKVITDISMQEGISAGYIPYLNTFILNYIACVYDYVLLDKDYGLFYKWDDEEMKVIPLEDIPQFTQIVLSLNKLYSNESLKVNYYGTISSIYLTDCAWSGNSSYSDDELIEATSDRKKFYLYKDKRIQRLSPTYKAMVIHNKSNVIEDCIRLLEWTHADQVNFDLINYGIKNTHYELVGDKINVIKDTFINRIFLNSKYIREKAYMNVGISDDDKNELDYSDFPPHQGFIPNCPSYTRKDIIISEIINKLYNCQCDKQQLETAIKKLKTEGVADKIVAEYQKQLNEWRELNDK